MELGRHSPLSCVRTNLQVSRTWHCSGRFAEKARKRGCFFVIANGNQYLEMEGGRVYPFHEFRGVQVPGNEDKYPLVLWEYGGPG